MDGRRKGQDGDITRPFDGDRHLSLVLRTVPGDPSGNDFPPFRNEISKDSRVPIVDLQFFIRAETTNLSPQERFFLSIHCWFLTRFSHSFLLSCADPSFGPTPQLSGSPLRLPPFEFDFSLPVFSNVVV
jgi:hypothetical protein